MQKVIPAAVHQPKLYSFDIVPSKSLICTGRDGRAKIWDVRRNPEPLQPEPIAELGGYCGSVTLLHMDAYKIVAGGPDDASLIWEANTGAQTNSFLSCSSKKDGGSFGYDDTMALNGCRFVTAGSWEGWGVLCFRDFNNTTSPVTKLRK